MNIVFRVVLWAFINLMTFYVFSDPNNTHQNQLTGFSSFGRKRIEPSKALADPKTSVWTLRRPCRAFLLSISGLQSTKSKYYELVSKMHGTQCSNNVNKDRARKQVMHEMRWCTMVIRACNCNWYSRQCD